MIILCGTSSFFHFFVLAETVGASSATFLSSLLTPHHLQQHGAETALPGGPVQLAALPVPSAFSPRLPASSSYAPSTHPWEYPRPTAHSCSVPRWVSLASYSPDIMFTWFTSLMNAYMSWQAFKPVLSNVRKFMSVSELHLLFVNCRYDARWGGHSLPAPPLLC